MRIVEPQKNTAPVPEKTERTLSNKKIVLVVAVLLIGAVGFVSVVKSDTTDQSETPEVAGTHTTDTNAQQTEGEELEIDTNYSGNEFRLLYESLRQANVTRIVLPPPITGNDIADTRIREVAETRGYKLRSTIINNLLIVDGYPMQPTVADDWEALQREATQQGLSISVTSAYRSIADQRQLFLSRLYARGVTNNDIISGNANDDIDEILKSTALPGYSKHHTGYTIDLLCAGTVFENFKNSPCHAWLSADNYSVAKNYGFMPSYPPDADLQGPDPEAWEYVWVGQDVLYPEL